jgi:hypothetical protein
MLARKSQGRIDQGIRLNKSAVEINAEHRYCGSIESGAGCGQNVIPFLEKNLTVWTEVPIIFRRFGDHNNETFVGFQTSLSFILGFLPRDNIPCFTDFIYSLVLPNY